VNFLGLDPSSLFLGKDFMIELESEVVQQVQVKAQADVLSVDQTF
jgi:hypothetical protein